MHSTCGGFKYFSRVAHKIQDFCSAQLSHVKHQNNKPAHILAKYAKEIDNNDSYYVAWIEEIPLLIKSAITHNVMNLSSS